jgi:hypothetical protein
MQRMQQARFVYAATMRQNWLCYVLHTVLDDASWLRRLRSTCGLSQADEAVLRKLYQELLQGKDARLEVTKSERVALGARATADVARHGLRSCTLPACGATEEYPKTYKLCGRCRGAAYCCYCSVLPRCDSCCSAASSASDRRHPSRSPCTPPSSVRFIDTHSKEDWKRHKREDGCAPPP